MISRDLTGDAADEMEFGEKVREIVRMQWRLRWTYTTTP